MSSTVPVGGYDRSHVLVMPKKWIVFRSVQLGLGVILFGFGIFGAIFAPFPGILMTLVTAIFTIIWGGYVIGSERSPHAKAYNYWAILGLEILLVIFWLISFALVATVVGLVAATYYGGVDLSDYRYYDEDYYDYEYDPYDYSGGFDDEFSDSSDGEDTLFSGKMVRRGLSLVRRGVKLASRAQLGKRDAYKSGADAAIGIFGAAAGLGAVEFVMFIASLTILSMRLHRHRKAGGTCQPGQGLPTVAPAGGAVENYGEQKIAMEPVVNVQPVQQQGQVPVPQAYGTYGGPGGPGPQAPHYG